MENFELKATVNIDSYNTAKDGSNPQQGSVGIGVLDSLYNKLMIRHMMTVFS